MRQITHYFSVPETPRIPVQPTGRKTSRIIPETPEIQQGEKQKYGDPTSQNKNEQSYLMNRNINTQDDIIIQELNNDSRTYQLIMNNILKIIQINKGDSELFNRTDQINELLEKHKPQLAIINELNLDPYDNITKNMFGEYKLEADNLDITDRKSRTGILVHKTIHYKRMREYETGGTSTVWLKLNHPGKKPILLQAIYRQFKRLGHDGSGTPSNQKKRWSLILSKWQKANETGLEIITLGDLNLNTMRWDTPPPSRTSYENQQRSMVEEFMDKILTKGFTILNSKPTRQRDTIDNKPACLDLMVTNRLEKIVSHESGISSFSDHSLQILSRRSKGIKSNNNFIRLRSYKNFKLNEFKDNIVNHDLYIETHYEGEVDTITENLQKIIQDSIEPMAPIKIVQISQKNLPKLSEKVRTAMAERDVAFYNSKKSKSIEEIRDYKHKKNEVNRLIAKEKFERTRKELQKEDEGINSRWKTVKN